MKIKFLEIYSQILKVKPQHQNGQLVINVRITKKRNFFEKNFTPRSTEEVFRISKIVLFIPITYRIFDLNGEEIAGLFYEQELQKKTQYTFRIEKYQRDKEINL